MSSFLLDTNCWMQIARARQHDAEVRRLLTEVPPSQLSLTDLALHSLGIAMQRHKVIDQFPDLVRQTGIGHSIAIVRLEPSRYGSVAAACNSYKLDFEDAYQYVAAELNGLALVSLDGDFDKTPRGRLAPVAALQRFKDEQSQQQPKP